MAKTTHKQCSKCEEVKLVTEFGVSRQGLNGPVYRSHCRACQRSGSVAYYWRKGRDAAIARSRESRFRKYGLTREQYEALLEKQNGVCAACGQPETAVRDGVVLNLSIDHDHDDGHVRGLLCMRCNRTLGLAGDDPEILKRLLRYMEEAP